MDRITIKHLKDVHLAENFTLWEMVRSVTATRNRLSNIPDTAGITKLQRLCTDVLQPLRNYFQKPVIVRTGYLCPEANGILNNSPNSQHTRCEAVDIRIVGISHLKICEWLKKNVKFDLAFPEYMLNDPRLTGWVHISYIPDGPNRCLNLATTADRKAFRLTKNFSLYELTHSDTATAHHIYNVPNETGIERLRQLCENVLQPIRDCLHKPVHVNSGFRSPALNPLIKGASKTSQHMRCEAADYEIMGMDNHDLANWVANHLYYDQLILEFHGDDSPNPNDGWVHTSFVSGKKKNRMQNLTIDKKGTRTKIARS